MSYVNMWYMLELNCGPTHRPNQRMAVSTWM